MARYISDPVLKGRICMVTGATSGIGAATAHGLARLGATVVIVGRNPRKCSRWVEIIQHETGNSSVTSLVADLSSQKEICGLAVAFKRRYERLDVLVNNAGGYFGERQASVDGVEMTFALNHLAYFLLTLLLLDWLKQSPSSRIINVASRDHCLGRIDFGDLMAERLYDRHAVYAQSKLANILFTYELARRLKGLPVVANALCPGSVRTNLGANNGWLRKKLVNILDRNRISPEQGAKTVLYLAASPAIEGVTGKYFIDQKECASSQVSYDEAVAGRLWQISEALTGMVPGGGIST